MFELHGVSKRYSDAVALENIDLSIEPERVTVVIGPSGCGKSTLLRLMLGLIVPDTGVVRFEGRALDDQNVTHLRQRVGFVVQEGGLFPHLPAESNIALVARYLRWSEGRIGARLRDLVSLTHFPPHGLARFPAQLSGGQRQRVALMRALMLDPDVLLLDEPLGALDPMIRFELQNELQEIFRQLGKTVVMVTHDLGEAAFFGDTIVLMRAGRIVQQGQLERFLDAPANAFVEKFIGAQRSLALLTDRA